MKRLFWIAIGSCLLLLVLFAQEADIKITLVGGRRPALALPDFKGAGGAAPLMAVFNQTLQGDLESSGLFRMVSKTMMPLDVPQQPTDFREPPPPQPQPRGRRQAPPQPTSGNGRWLKDWTSPPASADYLVIGYAAQQNDVFVVFGWLLDLTKDNVSAAQVLGKRYFGSMDETGARKTAHELAADIIQQFGGQSLLNSKIYFVSDRSGNKEIWSMDPDGSNQKQVTRSNFLALYPAVSPDGSKIACTVWVRSGAQPAIFVFTPEGRKLPFYNQRASMNATPSFTPDGKQIVYSSTASGWAQLYLANVDGSDFRRLTTSRAIDVEPKVNPKTGSDLVFVSGRGGPQQIYHMNMDGANVERLTPGEGEASNPSWQPDGQIIAYAWTRGYATGNFNIFVMDVATRKYNQLTSGAGRNENPSWAPDGRHIAFMSTRSGRKQIWSMLADGTQLRQLTTQGNNETPAWGKSGL